MRSGERGCPQYCYGYRFTLVMHFGPVEGAEARRGSNFECSEPGGSRFAVPVWRKSFSHAGLPAHLAASCTFGHE